MQINNIIDEIFFIQLKNNKIRLLFFLLLFGSCVHNDLPNQNSIFEVIFATIKEDSLNPNSGINNKMFNPTIYCKYCWKKDLSIPPPPSPFSISIEEILNSFGNEMISASRIKDSIFISRQIKNDLNLKINKELRSYFHDKKNSGSFYSFFIPIFSKDKTIAIELYGVSSDFKDFERYIVLKKINNKWVKVKSGIFERR